VWNEIYQLFRVLRGFSVELAYAPYSVWNRFHASSAQGECHKCLMGKSYRSILLHVRSSKLTEFDDIIYYRSPLAGSSKFNFHSYESTIRRKYFFFMNILATKIPYLIAFEVRSPKSRNPVIPIPYLVFIWGPVCLKRFSLCYSPRRDVVLHNSS
jgi:hypothetical protein